MLKKAILLNIALSIQAASISQEILETDTQAIGPSASELGLKPEKRIMGFLPVFSKALTLEALERLINQDLRTGDEAAGIDFDAFYQSILEAQNYPILEEDSSEVAIIQSEPLEIQYTVGPLKGSKLKFALLKFIGQYRNIPIIAFSITLFPSTGAYAIPVKRMIARIPDNTVSPVRYSYLVNDAPIGTSVQKGQTRVFAEYWDAAQKLEEKIDAALNKE